MDSEVLASEGVKSPDDGNERTVNGAEIDEKSLPAKCNGVDNESDSKPAEVHVEHQNGAPGEEGDENEDSELNTSMNEETSEVLSEEDEVEEPTPVKGF